MYNASDGFRRGVEHIMNWRLDPTQSLSDCTIEIIVKDADDKMPQSFDRPSSGKKSSIIPNKVFTYHVHRNVLANGPKRSLYFAKIFNLNYEQISSVPEQAYLDTTYKLYFTSDVAKVFPLVLDYIYSFVKNTDGTKRRLIVRNNVIAMNFIAKSLQITSLRKETETFFETDVNVRNCYYYYRQAHPLNAQKMVKLVTTTILDNLNQIKLQDDLLADVNAIVLWKHVVQSRYRKNTPTECVQLCTLVSCFCKLHRTLISKDDFNLFIDIRYMPVLHYDSIQTLLDISKELGVTDSSSKILHRFQVRCLDVYIQSWKEWIYSPTFQLSLSMLNIHELNYLVREAVKLLSENNEEHVLFLQLLRNSQSQKLVERESLIHQLPPPAAGVASLPPHAAIAYYHPTISAETNVVEQCDKNNTGGGSYNNRRMSDITATSTQSPSVDSSYTPYDTNPIHVSLTSHYYYSHDPRIPQSLNDQYTEEETTEEQYHPSSSQPHNNR